MSASARRHRRSVGRYRSEEMLRRAAAEPAVTMGSLGPYDIVKRGDVAFLVARPLPGMAPELADAIRLRRDATVTGVCACGGRRHGGSTRPGHASHAYLLHAEACPAHDRAIDELVARTGWKGAKE